MADDPENTLVIELKDGEVEIELLPDVAPRHVERIKALARAGEYDNVAFHRVIDGFMAQTGDVEHGDMEDGFNVRRAGTGGSSEPDLPAEFSKLPFDRGVVGMARSQNPNSGNSQFFIMFKEGHFLNGQYTVWGRVRKGMEHVDKLTRGEPPASPDRMIRVRVGSRRMIRRTFLALAAALGLAGGALAQSAGDVLVIDVDGSVQGTVEIALRPDLAPQHVARIKELARAGAYDGVVFHRVIDGFMAQTGDVAYGKRDTFGQGMAGTGGSDLPDLPAEFSGEHFAKGTVGMARSMDPNSANSQFFIMFAPAPHLDGQYTIVGEVVAGQEVVDALRKGAGGNGEVSDPDWMARVRVKGDS